jgi:hypothetical protein
MRPSRVDGGDPPRFPTGSCPTSLSRSSRIFVAGHRRHSAAPNAGRRAVASRHYGKYRGFLERHLSRRAPPRPVLPPSAARLLRTSGRRCVRPDFSLLRRRPRAPASFTGSRIRCRGGGPRAAPVGRTAGEWSSQNGSSRILFAELGQGKSWPYSTAVPLLRAPGRGRSFWEGTAAVPNAGRRAVASRHYGKYRGFCGRHLSRRARPRPAHTSTRRASLANVRPRQAAGHAC